MKNQKIRICLILLILCSILNTNFGILIYNEYSSRYRSNLCKSGKYSNYDIFSPSVSGNGNLTEISLISINNTWGELMFTEEDEYISSISYNVSINFKLLKIDFNNNTILDPNNQATYLINYTSITGTYENGTLVNNIIFNNLTDRYSGIIGISALSEGTYNITIRIGLLNYDIIPFSFILTLKTFTEIKILKLSDRGRQLELTPEYGYVSYPGSKISLYFLLLNTDKGNSSVLDENNQATYLINYIKTTGTYENGTLVNDISFKNKTDKYSGTMDTSFLLEGTYEIELSINLLNYTIMPFRFNLTLGKFTLLILDTISDPGGVIDPSTNGIYKAFIGSNISINFLLNNTDKYRTELKDKNNQFIYSVTYTNTTGPYENGTLVNNISFSNITERYLGIIDTSFLLEGTYEIEINIDVDLINSTVIPYRFFLTIRKKFEPLISIYYPKTLTAGEKVSLSVLIQYEDDSVFHTLNNIPIKISLLANNDVEEIYNTQTNYKGLKTLNIILPLSLKQLTISVEIEGDYYYESSYFNALDIEITSCIEFVTQILIGIGILVIVIGFILYIYKFKTPKKYEKKRILNEYKQTFEDLSRLEYIFIMHKNTREFLWYRSYISEKINSIKLNEINSFINSLKKSNFSQGFLEEVNYISKVLLLGNGKYLFIGTILGEKSSIIFKKKIIKFIIHIEELYKNEFSKNVIQPNIIEDIENIFEKKINLTYSMPHQIETNKFDISDLVNPYSIDIYELIKNIVEKTRKNYFYLSKIFLKFTEKVNIGVVEFLLGITELKNKNLIKSIKFSYNIKANS